MEDLRAKAIQGISEIARKNVDELSDIWGRIYEPENEIENLKMLLVYTEAFFAEIIVETQDREKTFLDRIESLKLEESDLKRVLKEEDSETTADVPLHTLQMNIEESVKSLRVKLLQRQEEIDVLLKEQEDVCNDLEEPLRATALVSDPLPSEKEMEEFRDYLETLNQKRYERHDLILKFRHEVKQLLTQLEITSLTNYDKELVSSNEMKPTIHNIEKLGDFHEHLASQVMKRKSKIKNMRKTLTQLWKYLDIPKEHSRQFAAFTDITQTTYNTLNEEVQRCELIKRENVQSFIEKVRAEIDEYWDKCLKSESERIRFRSRFPNYNENVINEDVLEIHEDELRNLKMFYEENENIINMINERQELWYQLEWLKNKEADPKRYNNRGGQLLKEEKARKTITMKLPKIESKLNELADDFEKNNNRPFTMYGVRIQDIIDRDHEVKRQDKTSNMNTRSQLSSEQRIINRTAMKTTGGLPVAQTLPKKALSTTTSSTASSVRSVCSDSGIHRYVTQRRARTQAKRQLLDEFASVASGGVLKPQNAVAIRKAVTSKKSSMKVYNIMRQSRKSVSNKRRSSIRPKRAIPGILLSSDSEDQSITEHDATRYEG